MLKKVQLGSSFGVLDNIQYKTIECGEQQLGLSSSEVELVFYIVNGKLSYKDSIGNQFDLGRGEVMHITAGENIEYNLANNGEKEVTYFVYAITPNQADLNPSSEAHKYKWKLRINGWLEVVSKLDGEAQIRVNQDVNIHALQLNEGEYEGFAIDSDRQALLVQIEGSSMVNGKTLKAMDSIQIIGEDISLEAVKSSHYIIIEMAA